MRTGTQAVAQMRRWSNSGKSGVKGLCLKTCREAYALPAKYPSAIIAWKNTPKKFKHTDPKLAPVGACHFYEGGKYGHIVLQSGLKNKVYGTDLPKSDAIGLHHRNLPTRRWGYKYLGWTNWLNGRELKLGGMPE
jgi:hypothetical protein